MTLHAHPARPRTPPRVARPPRLAAASLACVLGLVQLPEAQALNVVWGGGAGLWSSAGWVGSTAPGTSDSVYIDNGNVLHSLVTLNNSTYIGRLFIDSGDSLIVSGGLLGMNGDTISNNGTLTLAGSPSNWDRLQIGAAVTLSGTGTTVLASDP